MLLSSSKELKNLKEKETFYSSFQGKKPTLKRSLKSLKSELEQPEKRRNLFYLFNKMIIIVKYRNKDSQIHPYRYLSCVDPTFILTVKNKFIQFNSTYVPRKYVFSLKNSTTAGLF